MDTDNSKEELKSDIQIYKDIWEKYSHDKDKIEDLFNQILYKYFDEIDGLSDGLKVVSAYEEKTKLADVYRNNVKILLKRLEIFNNDEMAFADSMKQQRAYDYKKKIKEEFFNTRFEINQNDKVSFAEKNEVLDKLDEMEQISLMNELKERRWERLRPYILWVSGKKLGIAVKIINLLYVIGNEP